MESGKPQKQSLAIAYDVKRKAKKKMAKGGPAELDAMAVTPDKGYGKIIRVGLAEGGAISAKSEKRPMPDEMHNDSEMQHKNSSDKPAKHDSWTDRSTEKQAQSNNGRKVMPIAKPRMVPSNAFSTRMYDKEGMLEESAKPGPYGEQPPKEDNEMDADRQGPKVPDMQDEHSNHRKPYAKGGMINDEVSMAAAENDELEHPAHLEEDDDQMRLPVDEYMAGHFAKGGMAHEMDDQPEEEAMMEHHASIADAIMAKRDRKASQMSDSDIDEMIRLYEGGQVEGSDESMVDIDSNNEEQANGYYARNEHAALKENYDSDMDDVSQPHDSNMKGDSREASSENQDDMIDAIRRRMMSKRR